MPQCPLCNAEVTDDFGLTECSSCGAQLIVHVDGRVEHSGASESSDSADQAEAQPALDSEEVVPDFGIFADEEVVEEEAPPEINALESTPSDFDSPPPEMIESSDSEFAAPDEAGFLEQEEPPEPPEFGEMAPPAASVSDSPDLSDIAEFGNSANSGSQSGSLRYDLVISGIDTSDVRNAFREALVDKKLMWDTDEILRSIHNGEVRIENVSAVKANVLITRLRMLPFKIRWEQYAVHQS